MRDINIFRYRSACSFRQQDGGDKEAQIKERRKVCCLSFDRKTFQAAKIRTESLSSF